MYVFIAVELRHSDDERDESRTPYSNCYQTITIAWSSRTYWRPPFTTLVDVLDESLPSLNERKKNKMLVALIILSVLLILCITSFVAYALWPKHKPNDTSTADPSFLDSLYSTFIDEDDEEEELMYPRVVRANEDVVVVQNSARRGRFTGVVTSSPDDSSSSSSSSSSSDSRNDWPHALVQFHKTTSLENALFNRVQAIRVHNRDWTYRLVDDSERDVFMNTCYGETRVLRSFQSASESKKSVIAAVAWLVQHAGAFVCTSSTVVDIDTLTLTALTEALPETTSLVVGCDVDEMPILLMTKRKQHPILVAALEHLIDQPDDDDAPPSLISAIASVDSASENALLSPGAQKSTILTDVFVLRWAKRRLNMPHDDRVVLCSSKNKKNKKNKKNVLD